VNSKTASPRGFEDIGPARRKRPEGTRSRKSPRCFWCEFLKKKCASHQAADLKAVAKRALSTLRDDPKYRALVDDLESALSLRAA
jgi:hypothetical protein